MKKSTPKQQYQTDVNSETNSVESSPATTPMHQIKNDMPMMMSVTNSFSSIDLQSPSNRNLSEKELRDCDVIGTCIYQFFFKHFLTSQYNIIIS